MARNLISRSFVTLTRTLSQSVSYTPEGAVSVSYKTLQSDPLSLRPSIEEAFGNGPKALGIIIVKELPPDFTSKREALLRLANQFASLEAGIREKYSDPKSRYSFGWSHGKEIMNGKPDTLKGSFYSNPLMDVPNVTPEEKAAFPEYYGQNIWPTEDDVPGFEDAFKQLGNFVYGVGLKLAEACQPFASTYLTDRSLSLSSFLSRQTSKARLLHYFPPGPEISPQADDEPVDSWCGFHLDHSLLTGLTSAMFLSHESGSEPNVVGSPSPNSGLYIRSRSGDLTKVSIPVDCLAFQTGETLELMTKGSLRATPHCVRLGLSEASRNISRETFALFMQPDTQQVISATGETFGEFSKRIFNKHYGENGSM